MGDKYIAILRFYTTTRLVIEAKNLQEAEEKARQALIDDPGNDYRLARASKDNESEVEYVWPSDLDDDEFSDVVFLEEDEDE